MTVYPLVFRIGSIEITGYGLMMMAGFLMAGWVIQRRLRELHFNEDYAADIVVAAVIGGIVGAKLWYVALTRDPGALFSRGGLVWYGGFLGGVTAVVVNSVLKKVPVPLTADLAAPGVTIGYVLGRVGCFLVQDDYGRPSNLPWAMQFPEGLPPSTAASMRENFGIALPTDISPTDVLSVHPTQLYEVLIMLGVFAVLWRMRGHGRAAGWLFGLYLLLAGAERFLIEFLRAKDDRFVAGFTIAQVTSFGMMVAGAIILHRRGRKTALAIPEGSAVAVASPAAEKASAARR